VEITEGNPDEPAMKDGDTIESTEPASLTQILAGFQSTAKRVDTLVGDVDNSVKLLLTPQVGTDLGSFIHSLAGIAGGVENGHGLAHTLIFEPGLSNETTQAIHNLSQTASDLHQTIAQVNQTVGQVGQVVGQVGQVVAQVQTGNGMIHNLVYTQDKDELIHNLNDASRILKKIAIDTEEGKGTIGGLLRDPTVYEDLTTILGNVKRNVLLKALIRHEIVNDNLTRPGRIEAGPPEVSGGTTSNDKASAVTTEPKP
jgi:phospholipid/cholesterol/gamma-HCH transport system substrate-binding protein